MPTDDKELSKKLIALAKERFNQPDATISADDDFFDKLGIDSFQAMELLTDVENHFSVEIPDYELQGITTFSGLATVLSERLP